MNYDVGFILDGVILVFLAVTIFYAARLSIFLKAFRQERESMIGLIRNLSVTIDKAEGSIETMKQNAAETADEIQAVINEAKFLADELNYMNDAGDRLANRLEKLADRNKELVGLIEKSGGIGTPKIDVPADVSSVEEDELFDIHDFDIEDMDLDDEHDFMALEDGAYREAVPEPVKKEKSGFDIFDKEFLRKSEEEDIAASNDDSEFSSERRFASQAEQDLYEALQRKKRVREIS